MESPHPEEWLTGSSRCSPEDEAFVHYTEFAEVANTLMEGYARFIRVGLPGQTVAFAMLGATINLYDSFGMRGCLPALFRGLAETLENEGKPH